MTHAQRPLTVRAFEMLGIALVALELALVSGLDWSDLIWVPLMLVLIMSVTRSGSAVARWVFSLYCALQLALTFYLFVRGFMPPPDVSSLDWIMTVATMIQLVLLWSPAMSRWIASNREPDLPIGTRPSRAVGSHRS